LAQLAILVGVVVEVFVPTVDVMLESLVEQRTVAYLKYLQEFECLYKIDCNYA